ncbi:DNA recombination and repair protein RecF [Euzebya pacifica]|uniref:DNA replication and repair protein RecF n=1 Tax=Euzebya pacifica TaxID=1608957 RepID=A0A346XR68_9ACTN|nr:DNA recombination and repair protein RecF [Euzebya pacifica]
MRLESLHLLDVRNYERLDLELQPGVTTFVGSNAQGKTNLLEAVHYLSLGRSHRVSSDQAMVRAGADAAVIRAEARSDMGQRIAVSVELRQGRNRAQLNGQPMQRMSDAFGAIRSVMLAPEDLTLVRRDPGDRRRFLDDLLAGRRATFAGVRSDLDRALAQRNAVLKDARITGRLQRDVLEVWTDTYVNTAGPVLAARIAAINALAAPVAEAYADLVAASPAQDVGRLPVLAYELSWGRTVTGTAGQPVPDPAELAAELREALAEQERDEVRRGMTLVGPHRDELFLGIGDLPAKGYASHGEQWSLALALKLASHEVIGEIGDQPIVLLDDVFAELDADRRRRLAARCAAFEQVLVTAAVGTEVPLEGMRVHIRAGTVIDPPSTGGST